MKSYLPKNRKTIRIQFKSPSEVQEVSSETLRGFASSLTLGAPQSNANQDSATMRRRRRGETNVPSTTSPHLDAPTPDQQDDAMKPDLFKTNSSSKLTSPVQFETSFNSAFTSFKSESSPTPSQSFGTFTTNFPSSSSLPPSKLNANEVAQKTKELMVGCFSKLEKGQFVDALTDVDQSLKLFGNFSFFSSHILREL